MKVSFYPGCTAHSTGIEYNDSLHAAFEALGVEFKEIDVALDLAGRKEMFEKTGQMGVPVILVDDTVVIGFDKTRLKRLLNIKEKD